MVTVIHMGDHQTFRDPEDEVPWSAQIVCWDGRDPRPALGDVAAAAAMAVAELCATAEERGWGQEIARWQAGRIRKHCRRARGAAWQRAVAAAPGVERQLGDAREFVAVPGPVDQVPADIARCQLSGYQPQDGGWGLPETGLAVAVNPAVEMSAGKLIVQVAHAAHVAWINAGPDRRQAWAEAGYRTGVVCVTPAEWEAAWSNGDAVIRDAGFTEVAPNSHTVTGRWVSVPS